MKILIAEDTEKNLAAAKEATKNFGEKFEFTFEPSAEKAFDLIPEHDIVISDLFFETKKAMTGSKLAKAYSDYTAMISQASPVYEQVLSEYYGGDVSRAEQQLQDVSMLINQGLIRDVKSGSYVQPKQLETPYGGAIVLEAYSAGKPVCLVTNVHRHAGSYSSSASSIDGMILLMPLIEKEVITMDQAIYDGRGSTTYLGQDLLWKLSDRVENRPMEKACPKVWLEAILCTVSKLSPFS